MSGTNSSSSQQQARINGRSSRIGTAQLHYESPSESHQSLAIRIIAQNNHDIGTQSQNLSESNPWDQSSLLNSHHIYQPSPQFGSNSNNLFTPATAYYVTRGGRTTQRQVILDSEESPLSTLLPRQLGSSGAASSPQSRPQFRSKVVCVLDCKHCSSQVCRRGMKAILLADMNV